MCVIIVKEKGQKLISKENLKKCFRHNPDGAGIAWTDGSVDKQRPISIEKGFMKFDDLWDYLVKLGFKYKDPDLTDLGMIIHCRITTHGLTNRSNTHPFPLSENEEDLCAVSLRKQPKAIAHNGIVSSVTVLKTGKLSDTMEFIKTQLYPISEMNKDWNKFPKVLKAIEEIIGSKLAILNTDGTIDRVGAFTKHEDGLWYSNMHWDWTISSAWRTGGYGKSGGTAKRPYGMYDWYKDDVEYSYSGYHNNLMDDEFPFNINGNCCVPSTNSKIYEDVDSFKDVELEEDKQSKLDKLNALIDRGITTCKGSDIPKLLMNIDGEFIVDTILVDVDNDNKSYYGYAEEKFVYPIVANGFDEDVAITEWVAENKDKTFMFDIIIDN